MTKICVFGAGAIGGYIGARLALKAEAEVSLVARGPHLAAMEANGLILKQGGETFTVHPRVSSDPNTLGPQDYVIVTVKAHALTGVLDQLQPLIGKDTALLYAQNGCPGGISTSTAAPMTDGALKASIPVEKFGSDWGRSAPSAASSGRPPNWKPPA